MKHYASKVHTRHCVQAAQACGLQVGGIDFLPDGTIRVMTSGTAMAVAMRDMLTVDGTIVIAKAA